MSTASPRASPRVERTVALAQAVPLRKNGTVWRPDAAATMRERGGLLADLTKFSRDIKTITGFDLQGLPLTSDVVLSLAPFATQLKELRISDCGDLGTSTLSPLLICNVGSRSLRVLDLCLSSRQSIDGLFTTVSACCPRLVELLVSRGNVQDGGGGGWGGDAVDDVRFTVRGGGALGLLASDYCDLWQASVGAVKSLLSRCQHLSILGLEGMRFVENDDVADEKRTERITGNCLNGVSLVNCEFSLEFVELLCSHRLKYLEIVDAIGAAYTDPEEEDVAVVGATLNAGEIINIAAANSGHSLTSLALSGFGIRDHDVLAVSKGLSHLTRLSICDSPLLLGRRSFEYLKNSGLLQKLNRLDLLSDNSDVNSTFKRSSASVDLEPGRASGVGDEAIECFDDSNDLRELFLCGVDVTPAAIARKLPHLVELHVADCAAFFSPSEVCKLCRVNENVAIKEGDRVAWCAGGAFGRAFFDCYDEFGEALEGEPEDAKEEK